jgi:DNA-binding NarL/FixJ family response regulator
MLRLAIVDDHPVFRTTLRRILEREPDLSVVAEAGDGVAALAIVEEHKPDVVLIDVRLPKMDGLEATRAISSKHPRTRVIVLSLFTDDGTKVTALEAGACHFLCKDGNPKEIVAAIKDGHHNL